MVLRKSALVLAAIVGAVTMFACSGGSDGNVAQAGNSDAKKLYMTNCASCHGEQGNLGLSGAADLTKSTLSTQEKIQIVTNGKGAMMPYRELLNPQQIEAVVAHVETLK